MHARIDAHIHLHIKSTIDIDIRIHRYMCIYLFTRPVNYIYMHTYIHTYILFDFEDAA